MRKKFVSFLTSSVLHVSTCYLDCEDKSIRLS